jgi:hypothetical protein
MRVSAEEESHVENFELPSEQERTETDFYCASIPDEIDSILEESKERDIDQLESDNEIDVKFESNTIELSKQGDSIDINSIFCSESQSNGSASKIEDKNYVELWRELNDMAVDLIKQGIRLQEAEEEEEGEGEDAEDDEDRNKRAHECFDKAKAYLSASLNHANTHRKLFEDSFMISMQFNLAWVYQKISKLSEWAKWLDKVIKLTERLKSANGQAEFNKIRHLTKFQLQQWAIKSQTDDHVNALYHGKASVKHWHSMIFQTYKLCKKQVDDELKRHNQTWLRNSYKKNMFDEDSFEDEYGAKKQNKKPKNLNLGKSKYFQINDWKKSGSRPRRWYSEEDSSINSINLSTQKVVLNKHRGTIRESSLENIHTFHLKPSPIDKSLFKSHSDITLGYDKNFITNKKQENTISEGDNSQCVYVEERVKMFKNSQYHLIFRSLKELCKQIKEFKSYYLLSVQNQQEYFEDKQTMRKNLCVSFSDDDQINEINKDQTFKINTRSVLGVKNNNDWIYGLNIGNIMHLTPFMFDEVYEDINWPESVDKLKNELSTNNVLDKIILLSSAYFCIATELRFLNKKIDKDKFPKKLSEMWHAKSVHTWCWYLPKESPLSQHIHSSYIKHHLKEKTIQKEKVIKRNKKIEAKKIEIDRLEILKKQKEFKDKVINEFVTNTGNNKYSKCK